MKKTEQIYNELLMECKTLCKEFNSQEVELVFNLNDIEIDGDVSVTTSVGLVPELTGCSYVYNKTLDCSLLGMD